jgi:hypothetical protein
MSSTKYRSTHPPSTVRAPTRAKIFRSLIFVILEKPHHSTTDDSVVSTTVDDYYSFVYDQWPKSVKYVVKMVEIKTGIHNIKFALK